MSSITGNGTSHIYYNITLTNNNLSTDSVPPNVTFSETRNQPFLNCPEDYHMSVVRFSLETPTLPVLACIPKQPPYSGSDTVNTLQYQIFLAKNYNPVTGLTSGIANANLIMIPSSVYTPVPVFPVDLTDTGNPYWNCYSFQIFVDMVNTALSTAFDTLYGLTPPAGCIAPYLYWDIGSNTAVLNVSQNLQLEANGALQIFFNGPLYSLFSSFPARFGPLRNVTGDFQRKLYQITINTGPDANISSQIITVGTPPISTTVNTYNILQEYSTAPLWTPIDSIVFTTSMIPVNPELAAAPIVYNSNSVFTSIGTNASISNVLTDFIVPLTTGTEYKPSINYTPSGEYRLSALFGTNPVSSIQVSVYYKNRFGVLIPITLGTGCSSSIKIMFRRKDFSNIILN